MEQPDKELPASNDDESNVQPVLDESSTEERPPPNYGPFKKEYDEWKRRNRGPIGHNYSGTIADH